MWKWILDRLFADVDPGIPTERAMKLAHDSVRGECESITYKHGVDAALDKQKEETDAALAGWKGANEETDQHKRKLEEVVREGEALRETIKEINRNVNAASEELHEAKCRMKAALNDEPREDKSETINTNIYVPELPEVVVVISVSNYHEWYAKYPCLGTFANAVAMHFYQHPHVPLKFTPKKSE